MWIVAVFLWALLGSGTAAAFDCANATLPSSLVICGDPELIGLADLSAFCSSRASRPNSQRERHHREGLKVCGLSAGGEWIRTSGSAMRSHRGPGGAA
jgi:hypothetical protein